MSMFADYFKEFFDDETVEDESGFAIYRYLNEKQVYIVHIYTAPEKRWSGAASAIANKIVMFAKERGCTELLGSVVPQAKHSDASMRVLLSYGMKPKSIEGGMVIFSKEI